MHAETECLLVTIHARRELDAALDRAVDLLKPVAIFRQVGISVTRLAPGRYEVCLKGDIPPGTTMESWGTFRRRAGGRSGHSRYI